MSTTVISADDIKVGDYLIMRNAHLPRFALKVDKIGDGRRYVYGRTFSIGWFERYGQIAFSGNRSKLASLRTTTSIERIEVPA